MRSMESAGIVERSVDPLIAVLTLTPSTSTSTWLEVEPRIVTVFWAPDGAVIRYHHPRRGLDGIGNGLRASGLDLRGRHDRNASGDVADRFLDACRGDRYLFKGGTVSCATASQAALDSKQNHDAIGFHFRDLD